MCQDCESWNDEPVSLIRQYPKNKVGPDTTPAQYIEGWDIARGLYDLVDKSSVTEGDEYGGPVVGYYTEYRGAKGREYSQPMYTFKPAGEECRYCVTYPDDEMHLDKKFAHEGCECGNIAYASMDCPDHPLPSSNSRWVKMNQGRDNYCNHCEKELPQETWEEDIRWYCDAECKEQYKIAYERRQAEWRKRSIG